MIYSACWQAAQWRQQPHLCGLLNVDFRSHHRSFHDSVTLLCLSSLQVAAPAACQVDLLTQRSCSSRSPWPLYLFNIERCAKLASPAPSLPVAPDPDPDPDPEPDQLHTHEEQYVSEGDFGQLDTDPALPDYRDAETITGVCVCVLWNGCYGWIQH